MDQNPPEMIEGNSTTVPPLRQPNSIHGLLKFAMEVRKQEDAPSEEPTFQAMNPDRKKFLEDAVKSLTVDVIETLQNQIKILEKINTEDDPKEYVKALEIITEYVCDIDTANDFHKIGGFTVLKPCLKSTNAQIRTLTCTLLAELTQNNKYCQKAVLENAFMPLLIDLVENDTEDVIVKALYAVSCIVRDSNTGANQLIQYSGVQVLLETLRKNVDKFTIKICFLLTALCSSYADFRSRLVFAGYLPVLISLITMEHKPSHEYILGLLLRLVEDNPTAVAECRQETHSFEGTLLNYINMVRNKDEFVNEEEYCLKLQNILFPKH